MAEQSKFPALKDEEGKKSSDYTSDGRYIPYQGGSMGWFDNGGVLKKEVANNYRFHTMMDSADVTTAQFIRAGAQYDRRGDKKRVLKEIPVNLIWGEESRVALSRDISMHGIRLQMTEEISLPIGEQVKVRLLNHDGTRILAEIPSQVVWSTTSGVTRTLWNVGLSFSGLTAEASAALTQLIPA